MRERCRADIQRQCGTMRILNMEQAIALDDIYTDVQIFECVQSKQFKAILDYQEETANIDFNQYGFYGLELKTERIAGIEAVQNNDKLMVLGRPGAGKTTFLKRLAILCLDGSLFADHVPIFVTLQEFYKTKLSLFDFVLQKHQGFINKANLQQLLELGRGFVLLDGLDEVSQEEVARISKDIQEWAVQFWRTHLIVTCRLAAKESIFEDFKEVQVADFNDEQVKCFVIKWFQAKAPQKIEAFFGKLTANPRINEQARNPLLLTLLCLIFEEESKLIENRAELYEKGIDLLLERWDTKRDIQRDEIYKHLSTKRKEDLLSHIAWSTFGENNYFFKKERGADLIAAYIQNLPEAVNDPETLRVDSRKILRSIEAQHGLLMERASDIYSFSHLTFHEYFVAREIITVQKSSAKALQALIANITEKRWREVFLIATEMSPKADDLLLAMKQAIDAMLAKDSKLQKLLTWTKEKAISAKATYKPAAVRAFYFELTSTLTYFYTSNNKFGIYIPIALDIDSDIDRDIQHPFTFDITRNIASDLVLDHYLTFIMVLSNEQYSSKILVHALDRALSLLDKRLHPIFQSLKVRFSDLKVSTESPNTLKKRIEEEWFKDFRQILIKHRNIGHEWHFNSTQRELLWQYCEANKLLVACLNSKCYVSREVRQHIEDTLLLPVADIKPLISSTSPKPKRGFFESLFS